ncbi:sigma factor-like helix-turn-helix DNA-binding protein [Streptomyces sp. 150FB]|uniref:sigma factor-like helix-turn-helix DNA-binding protein n=1 Tax=Streptomyces sp. 150FB TaxID=1576605 RepID=UPI0013649391|nr:sigma factor-like helix-turn-helix DNA-binding protein [Streptomyces sp. 150FB]
MNDYTGSPERERDMAQSALDEEFTLFFAKHKTSFLKITASKLRNLHDADEALMEAAAQMHNKWRRIKAHPNPVALAYKILGTATTDFYRRRARLAEREVSVPGTVYTTYADKPSVDDLMEMRGYEGLERALASLGERAPLQAECVRLRFLADKDNSEIAAYLTITEGAAKTNISLGIKKLQALMDLPGPGKGDS